MTVPSSIGMGISVGYITYNMDVSEHSPDRELFFYFPEVLNLLDYWAADEY